MKFKKTILAALMAMALSQSVMAQTATIGGSGMGILQNEWVKAGVNTNAGTLGSSGSTSPGLLFDPTGTGTFNAAYDYLTPGSPFDGFSLKVDSENKTNNNTGGVGITKTSGLTLSNSDTTLSWAGAATYAGNSWTVNNAYTLTPTKPYIDITSTIVAGGAASTVYFAKFIDPDSQGMPGDSSSTDNVLGYGAIPTTNVAFSEATVSRYALGLYSAASNVTSGVNSWSSDAASYSGTSYYKALLDSSGNIQWTNPSCTNAAWGCDFVKELDSSGNPIAGTYGNSDDTIGLSFKWTDVTAGATLTASYAYIFGPSAFSASKSAVDGGAGGGTAGSVPGGGTLVDVGSATDAASGPTTPTVTGTATVNGTSAFADTAGDAVVVSTSMVSGDYLTRTYNRLTVTDTGRITTTPTTVVTSYSDGTTTSADGTPVTASETYFHSVDVTHNDVATSATPNSAARTHVDAGSVTLATPVATANADFSIRTGSASVAGLISRTSTTPTLFVYNRATTTVTSDDFSTSIYPDTVSTVNTTSVVEETYNVIKTEDFTRTVTKNVNDTATSATPNGAARTHVDASSVTLATPTVTANSDYSIRTGAASVAGLISRTSTTPTLFVYDRVVTTITADSFDETSVYTNTLSTVDTNSTVEETYNVVNTEDFTRTVTKDVLDTMTGSAIIGDIRRVSNGIDPTSLTNVKATPTTVNNGKSITVSAGGVIAANELYTVTTPTQFTYGRVVTTNVADSFALGSVYSNTSDTTNEASTVTGDYDVVSADSVGRGAAYDVAVNLRTDQVQTVNKLQGTMNKGLEFGNTIVVKRYDHINDGYTGHTNLLGAGHIQTIDGGMNLGLGVNKLDTVLAGNNSSVKAATIQLGATLAKKDVNGFDLSGTVQHSMTDYTASATPSVMVNTVGDSRLLATQPLNRSLSNVSGTTSGTDSSISVRATGPGEVIRPVIGATYGTQKVAGYTGNIEVLPGTVVSNKIGAVNDEYSYGTIGAVAKYDMFNATALHHTDGVDQIGVGLQKQTDDLTISVRADRLQTKEGGSTVYTAGLVYKF